MAVKTVTETTFHAEVEKSTIPVLVDFYADWCNPCRALSSEVAALSEEMGQITFAKVNVDENNVLAERFQITNIPCMILFENGEATKRIIGYRTREQIRTALAERN